MYRDPPARGGRREEEGPEDPSTSSSLVSVALACRSLVFRGWYHFRLPLSQNLACELGAARLRLAALNDAAAGGSSCGLLGRRRRWHERRRHPVPAVMRRHQRLRRPVLLSKWHAVCLGCHRRACLGTMAKSSVPSHCGKMPSASRAGARLPKRHDGGRAARAFACLSPHRKRHSLCTR